MSERAAVGRLATMMGTAAAVIGAFLFRFLTVEFSNDHYVHLSRGWQILHGDVPVRDFFDPGLILQYYASTAALSWSGHNLLGEAVLTSGFIAAGAGLTFVAAARLSRSLWIASVATLIGVLSTPRLYGYPKVFLYALAIVGAWHYAQRPDRRSIAVLAVITALAFLFRHDHGAYIGVAFAALIAMRHWRDVRQTIVALGLYGSIALILACPFLVFVQLSTGLVHYIRGSAPQAQGAMRLRVTSLPFTIDRTAPLVAVAPPPGPRVNIRWRSDIDDRARADLEQRHRLVSGLHLDGVTWSYVLVDDDREHITALLNDSAVADTHGIDRGRRELDPPTPLYLRLQRRLSFLRLRLAPGVFTRGNARALFYNLTMLLPFVTLAVAALLAYRGAISKAEASVAGMVGLLGLIIVQTLVRGSEDSRLPDVASVTCVAGAWVCAQGLRLGAMSRPFVRRTAAALVLVAGAVSLWSVGTEAGAMTSLETSQILAGPSATWTRLAVLARRLRERPIDTWTRDAPGLPGLGRYVFECTAPTDRTFVTWFAPEVFFYTERAFAGGQVYLAPGWHASQADQRLTVERLEHQRAPIVLNRVDSGVDNYFPIVAEYLRSRYITAPMQSETMKDFEVLVDRRLTPTGTYEPLGLPCYR